MNALDAIRAEATGGRLREERLAAVRGLVRGVSADGGERTIVEGPPGLPIDDLDALPFPARHLFPTPHAPSMWPYWDGFCQRRPAVQMHASRGCPYKCTFCLWISVIYDQGRYRTFSAKRIVDEMEEIVRRYGAREIYFDDDIFTVKEDHVVGLCEEILRRQLRVSWSVMGDAMAVTERSIDAMARAGCIGMKFGVESADAEVLKKLRKPIKIDKVRKVVDWCASRGIRDPRDDHLRPRGRHAGNDAENARLLLQPPCRLDPVLDDHTLPRHGALSERQGRRSNRRQRLVALRRRPLVSLDVRLDEPRVRRGLRNACLVCLAPRPHEGPRVVGPSDQILRARRAGSGLRGRRTPGRTRRSAALQPAEVSAAEERRSLRVLMLNHNVVWRSTFFRAFYFGRELADLGHRVTIATISPQRRLRAETYDLEGVRVVETPDWGVGLARTGWDPWDAGWRCRRFLGESFDVVHGFDCRPVVLVPSLVLSRRRRVPWISDWADCWGGDGGAISHRRSWVGRVAFRPVEEWLEEGFRHRAQAVTVTSRTLRDRAVGLGLQPSRVHYIPSGANVRTVTVRDRTECRRSVGIQVDGPVACFVGFSCSTTSNWRSAPLHSLGRGFLRRGSFSSA